jgi:ketosteroid isomerase-like protein
MTGRALVELDEAWAATATRDLDAVMDSWTDDAVMYLPELPPLYGKKAIREFIETQSARSGEAKSWKPCCAGIDERGAMAYTLGEGTIPQAGKPSAGPAREGRYVAIWRRDDGRWRCAFKCWTPST